MIDLVTLRLKAGDGGVGRVSFRREKYVAKGGPDGGDGGDGGSVIIRGKKGLSTLRHFAGVVEITAKNGQAGGKKKMRGARGEHAIIEVPLGTIVWLHDANKISNFRSSRYKLQHTLSRGEVEFQKYYVEKEGQGIHVDINDDIEKTRASDLSPSDKKSKLVEIRQDGEEFILCQGGFGGRGNTAFKGPANTTPLEAELGTFGEQKLVSLELKLLADVGLVGFPNAGKSSLLSKFTKARPKIGSYPFTTIEPNLGVLMTNLGREIVLADIPGLISGASEGKGLGLDFLRHIENCGVLWIVLFLDEHVVFDESLTNEEKAAIVWQQYQDLFLELKNYQEKQKMNKYDTENRYNLIHKPMILTLNKVDIYTNELIDTITNLFDQNDLPLRPFSAATGDGFEEIEKALIEAIV